MNKNLVPWIVIAILLVFIVVQTCTRPKKQDNYELIRENDSLRMASRKFQQEAIKLSRQRVTDSLQTTQTKKSYDSTSKIKDARIAYYRAHPKVIEIIKEVPVIDSAFQAYDSALQVKDERIAELTGELYNCQKLAQQAEVNFNETIRTKNAEIVNVSAQKEQSDKKARKEERKKKFNALLIPVVAVGSFLLGSQL